VGKKQLKIYLSFYTHTTIETNGGRNQEFHLDPAGEDAAACRCRCLAALARKNSPALYLAQKIKPRKENRPKKKRK
jgi:hypothetical protein